MKADFSIVHRPDGVTVVHVEIKDRFWKKIAWSAVGTGAAIALKCIWPILT